MRPIIKRYILTLSIVLSLCPLSGQVVQTSIDKNTSIDFWSDYEHEVLAAEIVNRMTDEDALAQIFMFSWAGGEVPPLLTRWVEERDLGSVKIFGWETQDEIRLAEGVTFLQEKTQESKFKIPLYVATDQEGGTIRHIKGKTSETPGNLAIGASGLPADAWYSGYYIGMEMRALGINMNFAPTVDIYSNIHSTVIASRSFSNDANHVGALGASFAKGSMDAGVIPTAKHFPGHGDTGLDSHGALPSIDIDLETLFNRELIPFQYLVEEGIPAIMSGHISFPQIRDNGEPASLSEYFIKNILRDKMGFEGLVITDDMMMNGATTYTGSLSSAAILAIRAGNDIIISSTTPLWDEMIWTASYRLMQKDEEYNKIVRTAAYRVILSKLEYFKGGNAVPMYPNIAAIPSSVPHPDAEAFFISQAAKAMTVYKAGDMPYTLEEANKEKILVVAQFQEFFDECHYRYGDLTYHFFGYNLSNANIRREGERILDMSKDFDTIIMNVVNDTSRCVAQYLKDSGKKVIIISGLEPVHVFDFDWADIVLLSYSYSDYSFRAAFSALIGDFVPQGILPMETE